VASAAIVSVFPVLAATLDGMRGTDRGLVELFGTLRAGRMQRWWKLELPWAIPSIVTGLRIAAGLSVIGAIVGDFYFRQGGVVGIGAQIDIYRGRLWGSELIASIILASAFGLVVFILFGVLAKLAVGKWHATTRGQ